MNVLVEIGQAFPLALAIALPVALLGSVLTYRMRHRSIAATLTVLGLVPLVTALVGVIGISGFMYTPQLVGTFVVVGVVAAVTVPTGLLLGRGIAREMLWQREAREVERKAEAGRRELVAGMSHDLRSPLAGIRGMTDALLDGVVHEPGEVQDYLGRIHRETVRMVGMVEDLFQLSRATSPALALHLTRLSLGEVTSDAVAAEMAGAQDAEVAIAAVEPERWPTVRASDAELTRVVRNLLANAIRYSPGGAVELSAGVRDGTAWLRVEDSCGGIPDVDLARIFDAGYRGTAARTPDAQSGAGLGLAIAKALVEAQDGTIAVHNHGRGCRFDLTLPLA